MRKIRTIAIGVGSTLLATTFIGLGLLELLNPTALGAFATWGYPERFQVLLAVGEIGGGVLLLIPRLAWYSAALLGSFLAGAIATHLWTGPAQLLVPAGALLIGVALAGTIRHPRTFAMARLRAVADAVAEREIARQHRQLPAEKGRRKGRPTATNVRTRPGGRTIVATNSASRSSEV